MSDISTSNRLSYERVVVPLDGSSFAEAALEVARQAGAYFGARIDLAGFGAEESDETTLQRRLLDVAADYPEAHIWTGVERHVAEGIAEVAGAEEPSLVCMASHARHGVPGALLHSVALGVLGRRAEPLLIVVANQPHGAATRSILGSTTIGVLHDTAVPVLVVPRPEPIHRLTVEHPVLGESLRTVVHGLGSSGI